MWAQENSDYKYQQGMNDIVATIMCCLCNELLFLDLSELDHYNSQALNPYIIFRTLHDPIHLYADVYNLFENLM